MKIYTAKPFSKEKYQLGEGPFYDSRTKTLSWVDITEGKFYTLSGDGKKTEYAIGQEIGAALPTEKKETYLIAGTDGLYLLDTTTESPSPKLIKDLRPYFESFQRSNDAKADSKGRLWLGSSVKDNHEPCGNLFCLDPFNQGEITCRQPDTKISNGMAWSRDHKRFYFSDSLEYAVFSYDYDEEKGEISNRQILFKVEDGVSDGMCIDSEDNLWVAFWGGSRIEQRSTKDGSLKAIVEVPATNVTSCCFTGESLDTLFITTSGNGLSGEYDGCLFTCKVQAKGLPCDYFKL